jgi:hypothetical protein
VPAPGYGTPADSVRFFDGTMLIGTAPVNGGVAAVTLSAAHLGDRSLTAVYKGDGKLFGSIAAMQALRVVARAEPVITGIADVEGDQGGYVTLDFAASQFDHVGSATPITGYVVYRALPAAAPMAAAGSRNAESMTSVRGAGPLQAALEGWSEIAAVAATTAPEYQLVVPTPADSNGTGPNHATFMVRALTNTPGVLYDSVPDSGYSVDNLPPAKPVPFTAAYENGAMHLHWGANTELDLCCYRLHRGDMPDFEPEPGNLIATLGDTGYVDPGPAGGYYKLAAVDVNGNVSVFAQLSPDGTTDVTAAAPLSFALERVQPNPSRGERLRVRFTLPTAAPARLELLDVSGRRVLERAVGALGPGRHTVEFAAGRRLAAGIYVVRLSQGASVRVTRVALLR